MRKWLWILSLFLLVGGFLFIWNNYRYQVVAKVVDASWERSVYTLRYQIVTQWDEYFFLPKDAYLTGRTRENSDDDTEYQYQVSRWVPKTKYVTLGGHGTTPEWWKLTLPCSNIPEIGCEGFYKFEEVYTATFSSPDGSTFEWSTSDMAVWSKMKLEQTYTLTLDLSGHVQETPFLNKH